MSDSKVVDVCFAIHPYICRTHFEPIEGTHQDQQYKYDLIMKTSEVEYGFYVWIFHTPPTLAFWTLALMDL